MLQARKRGLHGLDDLQKVVIAITEDKCEILRNMNISDEVLAAMRYGFEKLKLVIEPGGAVCLAAALAGKIDCRNKTTVLILSGGNVDPAIFAEAIVG